MNALYVGIAKSEEALQSVSLAMEGQETEIDRTILDAIKDPLTHIVRNAIDHGIEKPQARTASGKPEERDILNLLFLPGFSTAEKVTSISGRGVGMDVVKNNIERIGGTTLRDPANEPGGIGADRWRPNRKSD